MFALTIPVLAAALAAQAGDFSGRSGKCRTLPFADHLYVNLETLASEAELHADTCVRTKGRLRLHGRAKEQDPRSPWIVTPRAVRWLKVEGKLERRGTGTVLKASKVALATPRD